MAASPATAIWIVNAYQLTITMTLLTLASLGEIYEYRRVYRVGLVLFTAASLACALSHTIVQLTLARVLQGLGAAGIMSVNAALIRFIYPRAQLGRAIGINAELFGERTSLGQLNRNEAKIAAAIASADEAAAARAQDAYAVEQDQAVRRIDAARALRINHDRPRRLHQKSKLPRDERRNYPRVPDVVLCGGCVAPGTPGSGRFSLPQHAR